MGESVDAEGTVVKAFPGAKFNVELDNGHIVFSYLSGKIRINEVKIIVGDKVIVSMSPYDLEKGRIIKRIK